MTLVANHHDSAKNDEEEMEGKKKRKKTKKKKKRARELFEMEWENSFMCMCYISMYNMVVECLLCSPRFDCLFIMAN